MDFTSREIHTGWEFAFTEHEAVLLPDDADSLEYRPASVPGTNLTDLQAHGLVEPDTSPTYEDSFAPFKDKDFVYRTTFSGGDLARKRRAFLAFDGLDTVCDLFLNGRRLGSTENAHRRYRFDVTGRLSVGANTLVLAFRSPMLEAAKRREAFGQRIPAHLDLDFMFLRKPAYSYFWDWGPEIPVSGVFRPVRLEGYDTARIADFHVRYAFNGDDVKGTVAVFVDGDAKATARVAIAHREFSANVVDGVATVAFAVANVQRWHPVGDGDAYLYDMTMTLVGDGTLDSRTHRIGFRTVEVVREPRADGKGRRFRFRVNGKDIFARGYNWIPVDNSVPRGVERAYRVLLDLARASNCNMLRVWGGGYYESDLFYRLCDEMGVLVWQDGMFACAMYPDTDEAFLSQVDDELRDNIRRLRNYTSLAIWCGENENHWGWEEWWTWLRDRFPTFLGSRVYDELYPALVRELDPDRFYWNGSPYSEEPGVRANHPHFGDTHFWDLHSNCQDFSGYLNNDGSFISETGIQSLPDLRTALTVGSEEDRNIQSFVFDTRNHFENPAKNDRLIKFTAALFRVTDDFRNAVVRSNLGHAEYLKYAVEHWRSRAYDCAGVLIWQLNDCWPAISWSAVDYNLCPKACYYYMARAFAPDLVGFKQRYALNYGPDTNARGELFVASERDGKKTGVVELRVVRLDGTALDALAFPVTLDGRGAVSLGEIVLPEYRARRFDSVAEFTLRWDDGTTARNVYTFSRPKHMRLTKPNLVVENAGEDVLRVRTDVFAKGVYLYHPNIAVVFSDNYFDLMPGEERRVRANGPVNASDVEPLAYYH